MNNLPAGWKKWVNCMKHNHQDWTIDNRAFETTENEDLEAAIKIAAKKRIA